MNILIIFHYFHIFSQILKAFYPNYILNQLNLKLNKIIVLIFYLILPLNFSFSYMIQKFNLFRLIFYSNITIILFHLYLQNFMNHLIFFQTIILMYLNNQFI